MLAPNTSFRIVEEGFCNGTGGLLYCSTVLGSVEPDASSRDSIDAAGWTSIPFLCFSATWDSSGSIFSWAVGSA